MIKQAIILFTIISFFFGCKKSSNFIVEGRVSNSEFSKIYITEYKVDKIVAYDSVKIKKDGTFKFQGKVSQPTFFQLVLNEKKFIYLLVDSADHVKVMADNANFSTDYLVEGSKGSILVQRLMDHFKITNYKLDSIDLIELSRNDPDYDTKLIRRNLEKEQIIKKQIEFSSNFVNENPFSLASVLAIYQRFNNGEYIVQDLQIMKMAASALNTIYPNSEHVKALYDDVKKLMSKEKAFKLNNMIKQYGANSPDVSLPDQYGVVKKLSALRGKIVLVHFWSALDRGSRIMNPALKELYNQFKSKNFEIYQICIDTDRNVWTQALKEDMMTWINVSDTKGCVEAVQNFNIKFVPSNYLLDKEGNILAKDLQGPQLYRAVSENVK